MQSYVVLLVYGQSVRVPSQYICQSLSLPHTTQRSFLFLHSQHRQYHRIGFETRQASPNIQYTKLLRTVAVDHMAHKGQLNTKEQVYGIGLQHPWLPCLDTQGGLVLGSVIGVRWDNWCSWWLIAWLIDRVNEWVTWVIEVGDLKNGWTAADFGREWLW